MSQPGPVSAGLINAGFRPRTVQHFRARLCKPDAQGNFVVLQMYIRLRFSCIYANGDMEVMIAMATATVVVQCK